MRQAFTFIEGMICVVIFAIICCIAIPNLIEAKAVADGATTQPIEVKIGTDSYKATKYTLEGHKYIHIRHSAYHGFSDIHDPDCGCGKVVKVELEKSGNK